MSIILHKLRNSDMITQIIIIYTITFIMIKRRLNKSQT